MIEQILADYDQAYGLRHIVLRYFNAAGADPAAEIGERHAPETHLIPLVILAALGHRDSIEVYGTDYQTPDGTAIRDYIHVTDLADAHVRALQLLNAVDQSESFNLGTGRGTSVREIINAVERISGKQVPVSYGPRRPGDPPELVSGSQKATEKLKWNPSFTDIDSTIKTAWNFHSKIDAPR
jgi:UDP-glucose-4-epimerase GalE